MNLQLHPLQRLVKGWKTREAPFLHLFQTHHFFLALRASEAWRAACLHRGLSLAPFRLHTLQGTMEWEPLFREIEHRDLWEAPQPLTFHLTLHELPKSALFWEHLRRWLQRAACNQARVTLTYLSFEGQPFDLAFWSQHLQGIEGEGWATLLQAMATPETWESWVDLFWLALQRPDEPSSQRAWAAQPVGSLVALYTALQSGATSPEEIALFEHLSPQAARFDAERPWRILQQWLDAVGSESLAHAADQAHALAYEPLLPWTHWITFVIQKIHQAPWLSRIPLNHRAALVTRLAQWAEEEAEHPLDPTVRWQAILEVTQKLNGLRRRSR